MEKFELHYFTNCILLLLSSLGPDLEKQQSKGYPGTLNTLQILVSKVQRRN